MKHSLQLKLSQHLTLTPQLQQSIRLLQLSTLELNQEIETFLQDNPLLEREEDDAEDPAAAALATTDTPAPTTNEFEASAGEASTPTEATPAEDFADAPDVPDTPDTGDVGDDVAREALDDTDWADESSYGSGSQNPDGDDNDFPQVASASRSLREHLTDQLATMKLSHVDRQLVALLIDSLDDDGYLEQDLAELAAILPEELDVGIDELSVALTHLQHLDPAGVGARNLSECLTLQLRALAPDTPWRDQAMTITQHHLDALAARDYARMKKALRCDDDTMREVQKLIVSLNPRPAAGWSREEARYVVADVTVRKIKGVWTVALNPDAMPKLRINRMYADILARNRDASHAQLSGQLQEAKWLIKNVQQRFDTILRVSQCIVDRQRHFFEHGEVAMRPLVLREIAEILGLHESTVSRVTTQKFMHTPRGIFELKYFFGSHVSTETGGACSATAIRALIRQLVGEEDTRKPLSDSQISEILGKQGIVVARRTIAKYRESLQILPVNLRKSL
jgi:RNA polymerase sigma-54 factor